MTRALLQFSRIHSISQWREGIPGPKSLLPASHLQELRLSVLPSRTQQSPPASSLVSRSQGLILYVTDAVSPYSCQLGSCWTCSGLSHPKSRAPGSAGESLDFWRLSCCGGEGSGPSSRVPVQDMAAPASVFLCLFLSHTHMHMHVLKSTVLSSGCGVTASRPHCVCVCACSVPQLYLTLCDPMDLSPSGSSIHGISQARILDWVAVSSSRGSSQLRDQTCISCIDRWILSPLSQQGSPDKDTAAAAAKSLQSCPILCDPTDSSPPGSPVSGILQARTLEWVAISFSNTWKWKVKVKSLSCVLLLVTPWTAVY